MRCLNFLSLSKLACIFRIYTLLQLYWYVLPSLFPSVHFMCRSICSSVQPLVKNTETTFFCLYAENEKLSRIISELQVQFLSKVDFKQEWAAQTTLILLCQSWSYQMRFWLQMELISRQICEHARCVHFFFFFFAFFFCFALDFSRLIRVGRLNPQPPFFSVICTFNAQVEFLLVSLHVFLPSCSWSSPAWFTVQHCSVDMMSFRHYFL